MRNRSPRASGSQAEGTRLRSRVLRHLWKQGYSTRSQSFRFDRPATKDDIRRLHAPQRRFRLHQEAGFVIRYARQLIGHFADGSELEPKDISPELVPVAAGTHEARLFRFASLLWSVPTSAGFGRRLRYLVRDASNGRLIGLFALGDPVFNLSVRDDWIGWDLEQKTERLCNVMDAYVVGAVPPYSCLLGGKLVGALIAGNEVRRRFRERYGDTAGVISGRCKHPRLVLVTTSSALGKSSMYNRLRICDTTALETVGFTRGYGYFHLDTGLFSELRDYLAAIEHPYVRRNRFGQGPNWKMRVIRVGLRELGIDENILHHGVRRQLYALSLGARATEYLQTGKGTPALYDLPVAAIVHHWRHRWLLPRAERRSDWQAVTRHDTLESMLQAEPSLLRKAREGTLR